MFTEHLAFSFWQLIYIIKELDILITIFDFALHNYKIMYFSSIILKKHNNNLQKKIF